MIAYRIRILPLIREIQEAHIDVIQTCYAGNAGYRGVFGRIKYYLEDLICRDPSHGELPETIKSSLFISERVSIPAKRWDWR